MVSILKPKDADVRRIAKALERFEEAHEQAHCTVYRYNPASIRVRIVDSTFEGRSRGERHDFAMQYLCNLPDEVLSQISILLCLVPNETSLMDLEFSNPRLSQL